MATIPSEQVALYYDCMTEDAKTNNGWMWASIALLLIIIVVLLLSVSGKKAQNTNAPAATTTSSTSKLQDCENAAHQQYDPQIRVAMGSGTSMQPMEALQQALATCHTEYSGNQ